MSTTPRANTPDGRREAVIDEMVDESFPASDAPQLSGRSDRSGDRATAPEPAPRTADEHAALGVSATIGNQGAIPASGVLEETVPLSDQGAVHLRFDGGFRHLHVYLEEGLALDGPALDRLIAVLSQKRARIKDDA